MSRARQAERAARKGKRAKGARANSDYGNDTVVQFPGTEASDDLAPKVKRDNTPIEARNENQQVYLDQLNTKQLIFATGEAGCGKTFLSAAHAAQELIDKNVERIIVTRPVLESGENLGFLPGDISEKFSPYFRPVQDILEKRLGGSFLQYCLRPDVKKVEIAPFAYMRGRTFENAVVILDEAQNVTKAQMKMFLTRLGENVTVIVNGDVAQCDLPKGVVSGLSDALKRFKTTSRIGVVEFTAEDCVRSELCQEVLYAYEHD